MADNKKEQERDDLHKAIWGIADDLRGAVDGWDFKQYVLGFMFYRYISENLTNYINAGEHAAGHSSFDYAKLSDDEAESARNGLVKEKGFFILPSELFCNVRKRADKDENLNETLERIFNHIEESAKGSESESDFAGLFDDIDVNSNKLGSSVIKRNEKLVKLLNGIGDMKLGNYQDNTIDAFGDAYEYLMSMYASSAGKSGGEFYTPQEVSELLTRLAVGGKKQINKIYDPACGSGSLLLKAAKILGKENVRLGFFGQEINITTYNLCRINMFLHDIPFDKFDIACEDTLISPQHWDDEPFEAIVSNPPYSIHWAGDENPLLINDPRYSPAGVLAPKKAADMAFIMHSLSWLANNGTAAIVCFPGIMYRGGAEKKIRKYLIDNNYVDCVIQLPDNLFFGTSIATCILVLKKGKADNSILFIDASKECIKVTNNNKLTDENIDNIVNEFVSREEKAHYAHRASYDEVAENDYNLSVSSYVTPEDRREIIDIVKLNAELKEIVAREQVLRDAIDKIVAEIEGADNTIGQSNRLAYEKHEPKAISDVNKLIDNTVQTGSGMAIADNPEKSEKSESVPKHSKGKRA
ncbi:type I restriction-modification system subunit M [Methanomicrobium mobile]|uniref:type I restriction-modification system subunit M n=1 Tax=Methanomicrobium mobile TaxID=2205 RepID=UPI000B29F9DB|nr:type I restriction-modification system subunit M [Methanomicrobium mobile]